MDVKAIVLFDRLAIRIAAVIYPARGIPVAIRVDHHIVVEQKQEGVVAFVIAIQLVRLLFGNEPALVLDDALAFRDWPAGEDAFAVDLRTAHDDDRTLAGGFAGLTRLLRLARFY